ncbi:hypothetical protein T4E_10024 [Trichinella pseudospiralis]|uniref:Uncharacterized protein n=1 Tax=Trichinella pseudospiralis TaxID=6337 RepID=A0A0V0Y9E9_TRIPS|nr:hypothetical protein T4E_10024 [Trichinella pseudospiralis]KRY83527.1 hypothetical protein T4D_951 [Trichinella pseudospiralis]
MKNDYNDNYVDSAVVQSRENLVNQGVAPNWVRQAAQTVATVCMACSAFVQQFDDIRRLQCLITA